MLLHVGKRINLRERVASHFSADYRSANDLCLSFEVVRIEFEETATAFRGSGFSRFRATCRQRISHRVPELR